MTIQGVRSTAGAFFYGAGILTAGLFLSATLFAQSTATMRGRVLDPSGVAVAGAALTLESSADGFRTRTESAGDGGFRFTNLPFGGYLLTVEKAEFAGFSTSVALRSNVPAEVTRQY